MMKTSSMASAGLVVVRLGSIVTPALSLHVRERMEQQQYFDFAMMNVLVDQRQ